MSDRPHFVSDDHVLRTGFLAGTLLKAGIRVEIETDDEGNYTDEIIILLDMSPSILPATRVRLKVLPPRDEDD